MQAVAGPWYLVKRLCDGRRAADGAACTCDEHDGPCRGHEVLVEVDELVHEELVHYAAATEHPGREFAAEYLAIFDPQRAAARLAA